LPSLSLLCWARSNRRRAEKTRHLKLLIVRESPRASKAGIRICYILVQESWLSSEIPEKFQTPARSTSAASAMNRFHFSIANLAFCFLFTFVPAICVAQVQRKTSATNKDVQWALESAHALMQAGRYSEAIEIYRRALLRAPRSEPAELGLSEAYRGVHNYEEARSILQTARREHPKSVGVLSALGSLEMEAESYDAAIEALRVAVALAPDDVRVRNLLGSAYLSKGDSATARIEFEKVLARDAENQLAHFSEAEIFANADQNEKALADAERVVAAKPEYLPGRALLAKILVRLKQCERAADILRPAMNPPKLDTPSLFLLANAYECAGKRELAAGARGEFAVASQADRKRAEDETQSKHLMEQANELARQNRFPEALELLQQALEKNPQNGFAYSQQAKIYFSMHDAQKASEAIGKALAIQPFQPDFLYVAGVIAAQTGKQDQALAAFEKVTQVNPKEADAYYEIGKIRLQQGDRVAALVAFRRAVALDPSDPDYLHALMAAHPKTPPRNP
jgi:tetratricopeptide (TPR) repeat protein